MGWMNALSRRRRGSKTTKNRFRPSCTALVAAAGSSSRMGGGNKLLMTLDGIPVLVHTVRALDQTPEIDEIVVAAREEDLVTYARLFQDYRIEKPVRLVRGGSSRTESVLLAALDASPQTVLLAVQDGARPLVTPELIARVVTKAARCQAAAPAIPVRDTIKVARNGTVDHTLERDSLVAVQTPQVFDAALLKAALQSALDGGISVTDDCAAVERLGKIVYLVDGDPENLKITVPMDLLLAERILQERL